MKHTNEKGILITGATILRGLEVIIALLLIHAFVHILVFGQQIDTMLLLMMTNTLFILENVISRKRNEQDDKKTERR